MLTQQRPMINESERLLPDWTTCTHQQDIHRDAIIDKTINVTLREFDATV